MFSFALTLPLTTTALLWLSPAHTDACSMFLHCYTYLITPRSLLLSPCCLSAPLLLAFNSVPDADLFSRLDDGAPMASTTAKDQSERAK